MSDPLATIERLALELGATGVRTIPAGRIAVRPELADLCLPPACPNYGRSMRCPPHVPGPEWFQDLLKQCRHGVVIVLEAPTSDLLSEKGRESFRLLQQIVARIEQQARSLGFDRAHGFAGGCCRQIFCDQEDDCAALSGNPCRHPDQARPSMSGFGVDVKALVEEAGWQLEPVSGRPGANNPPNSLLVGLVLADGFSKGH